MCAPDVPCCFGARQRLEQVESPAERLRSSVLVLEPQRRWVLKKQPRESWHRPRRIGRTRHDSWKTQADITM